jgi:hypothetical protein
MSLFACLIPCVPQVGEIVDLDFDDSDYSSCSVKWPKLDEVEYCHLGEDGPFELRTVGRLDAEVRCSVCSAQPLLRCCTASLLRWACAACMVCAAASRAAGQVTSLACCPSPTQLLDLEARLARLQREVERDSDTDEEDEEEVDGPKKGLDAGLIVTSDNAVAGQRVVRGPDWEPGWEMDGGKGKVSRCAAAVTAVRCKRMAGSGSGGGAVGACGWTANWDAQIALRCDSWLLWSTHSWRSLACPLCSGGHPGKARRQCVEAVLGGGVG